MDTSDAMDNDDTQKRTFPKKGATDPAIGGSGDKELASGPLEMIKGGGSGDGSGPTGSSRAYPKGGKPSMDAGRFNPMNSKPVGYATAGVGKGED